MYAELILFITYLKFEIQSFAYLLSNPDIDYNNFDNNQKFQLKEKLVEIFAE